MTRWLAVLWALLRLARHHFGLLYWALPRAWRGGYVSPWSLRSQVCE